jgi:uncharacterized protein
MATALTYPGVYVEELASGGHTITGVATSIAAFIGWAPQGPVDQAVLVESWSEYRTQFGGLYAGSYLGYSVNQFFANGGQQAYIVRLAWDGGAPTVTNPLPATAVTATGTVGGSLVLWASSPGEWGNNLQVKVVPQSAGSNFSLQVIDATTGSVLESYANLSTTPGDVQYVVTVIDNDSQYITFIDPAHPTTAPPPPAAAVTSDTAAAPTNLQTSLVTQADATLATGSYSYKLAALYGNVEGPAAETSATTTPAKQAISLTWDAGPLLNGAEPTGYKLYRGPSAGDENVFFSLPPATVSFLDSGLVAPAFGTAQPTANVPVQLTTGANGAVLEPGTPDFTNALLNDPSGGGLELLDRVPIFNMLCVPGESDPATIQELQAYCAANRAFCIVDAPSETTIASLRSSGPAGLTNAPNAANSALYFPWVSAPDPLSGNRPTLLPPSGFVAGIYARTDATRGVWKAPAGLDAGLTGELGLQFNLTDLENGDLNIQGINCLRSFRVYGDVVWGARTLVGADAVGSEWKYVPIRRFALFLESSLLEGTQWVVFEPNDERLWGQIRLNVGAFMQGLFLQGAFQGSTPQQAYFVKCDSENNPQSSIDQGIVTILVGFMPLYPAEFVVLQIQQIMASQA